MANGKNLDIAMPSNASFTYGKSGKPGKSATRILKGGDLRNRKSNNNGR